MKFSKLYLGMSRFLLRSYTKLVKISGLYYFIDKNDLLFDVYIIPHRIHYTIKRIVQYNYPVSYVWDILSGRYEKYRKGSCSNCGECCRECTSLIEENGKKLCKIYKRRDWCDIYFPVSPQQQKYLSEKWNLNCGYYFEMPQTEENKRFRWATVNRIFNFFWGC
ncbi:MAG: hypothetical protein PHC34_08925 [Candidatus Gastranaerophilales bacterium]|nr:hypothetical protein [Candidatus Gastranaerophilales bacterium]